MLDHPVALFLVDEAGKITSAVQNPDNLDGIPARDVEHQLPAKPLHRPDPHALEPGRLEGARAAQLRIRQLRNQGTPIPTNDLWIAALVMQHNLVLCSRDRHFTHLPQLDRLG